MTAKERTPRSARATWDASSTESLPTYAAGAPMRSSDAILSLRVVGTARELMLSFSWSLRVLRVQQSLSRQGRSD